MATARVWVDNIRKPFFIKKKGQYYLQTWHGGLGLKKVEKDALDKLDKKYTKWAKRDAKKTDLMLSSSKTLSYIFRNSFWYQEGDILEKGLPRNDLLLNFKKDKPNQIKNRLGINHNSKVLLYTPTFRDDGSTKAYDINFSMLTNALKKRFGGNWIVLLRLHPNIQNTNLNILASYIKNVSSYNDIQELYLITDFLITDYSSTIFDFTLTEKPSLLYASDIEEYAKLRDYYFDFNELPFILCETNCELENAILNFDTQKHKNNIKEFNSVHGLCESGKASSYAARWIIEKCFNKNV
jgi:CDP-glycerol glycerophosphotransferase